MADQGVVVADRGEFGNRANVPAETSASMPDVSLKPMPPWQIVAVRVGRTWIQCIVAFAIAAGVSVTVPEAGTPLGEPSLAELGQRLMYAFIASLGPTFIALLMNVGELLAKIDQSSPRLRA